MKQINKDIRYYLDIDLETLKIISWGSGDKYQISQILDNKIHHRLFITEGQYNKLVNNIEK